MEKIKDYLTSFFDNHRSETILLGVALLVMALSLANYFIRTEKTINSEEIFQFSQNTDRSDNQLLYIEVSGAVTKPDMYALRAGTRLKEAIKQAGGLADNADRDFFARNFNLSRILNDQDKIYVPSQQEIQYGIIKENTRTLDYASAQNLVSTHLPTTPKRISLNSASADELNSLSGIGQTLAKKIISNRPYSSLNDLVSKKVISSKLLSSLTDQIEL